MHSTGHWFGPRTAGRIGASRSEAADTATPPKDEGPINTRSGIPGDTMRLKPQQIGAFDPSYLLEGVARAATAPDQLLLREPVEIAGPLTGYAAAALIGSNSPVFPDIHARWTPIVNAYDSLGRLRGAVAAVVRHWRGPFAGSSWALLGVDNRDLIGDDPAGPAIFEAMLRAVTSPVFLHELSTEWACYRGNETVRASVAISNHSKSEALRSIRFQTTGEKPVVVEVAIPPGETRSVEATIHEGELQGDFHTVTAELLDPKDGSVVDRVRDGVCRLGRRRDRQRAPRSISSTTTSPSTACRSSSAARIRPA